MKKANTPSFIVELPIKTLPFDIKELSVRLDVGDVVAGGGHTTVPGESPEEVAVSIGAPAL